MIITEHDVKNLLIKVSDIGDEINAVKIVTIKIEGESAAATEITLFLSKNGKITLA